MLLKALSRLRPRVLTVLLLLVVAGLLVLANLSDEFKQRDGSLQTISIAGLAFDLREPASEVWPYPEMSNLSYGWPLLWRQYVVATGPVEGVLGEYRSSRRLAGNLAMWLGMLALPAAL